MYVVGRLNSATICVMPRPGTPLSALPVAALEVGMPRGFVDAFRASTLSANVNPGALAKLPCSLKTRSISSSPAPALLPELCPKLSAMELPNALPNASGQMRSRSGIAPRTSAGAGWRMEGRARASTITSPRAHDRGLGGAQACGAGG